MAVLWDFMSQFRIEDGYCLDLYNVKHLNSYGYKTAKEKGFIRELSTHPQGATYSTMLQCTPSGRRYLLTRKMKPHIKKVDGLWCVVNLRDIYAGQLSSGRLVSAMRTALRAEKANAFCASKNLKEKR